MKEIKEWFVTGKVPSTSTFKDNFTGLKFSDSDSCYKTVRMTGTFEEFDEWSNQFVDCCDSIFKLKDCGSVEEHQKILS